MIKHRTFSKELSGSLAILGSAFCFYLSTVVVRWATTAHVGLNSQFLVFFRFLFGFLVIVGIMIIKRKIPRPHRYRLLFGRMLFNTVSVACFFKAIEVTTVAESNILNMTYPVFIAVISWFLFRERHDVLAVGMTFVAFVGIVLVLAPAEFRFASENLWGLASGSTAALAIIFLQMARQHNDTDTVLLVMFGGGTLLLGGSFWNHLSLPTQIQGFYLVLCGSTAFLGQYLLTLGFRYVSAVKGSIISLSRILLAALLGPYLTADPHLTAFGWVGALLILTTNTYFITRKSKA
jgi:drug/metabolite transporter (DMT)-like permease